MGRGSALFDPTLGTEIHAKMTQSSTNAPAMGGLVYSSHPNVSTTTSITLARTGTGVYTLTLTGKWTVGKTFCKVQPSNVTARICEVVYTSADVITLNWFDAATPSAADSGDFDLDIFIYQ